VEYRHLLGDLARSFLSVCSMGYISLIYAPGHGDNILSVGGADSYDVLLQCARPLRRISLLLKDSYLSQKFDLDQKSKCLKTFQTISSLVILSVLG